MKQSLSLGQVFLKDRRYIDKIIGALDTKNKHVLEIGPGPGQITQKLLETAGRLTCVELDYRYLEILRRRFGDNASVTLIHGDILKIPLNRFKEPLIVFGNIPYQISNCMIRYLIRNRGFVERAYLTFQREFADKLIAPAGHKKYSFLSCFFQYYAKPRKLFDIPPESFNPAPKVHSSFMAVEFYERPPVSVSDEERFFKMLRRAFNGRRKKLVNSLGWGQKGAALLESLGINPNCRPQELNLGQFAAVYQAAAALWC